MDSFRTFEAQLAAADDDSARVVVLNHFAAAVAPTGDLERALSLAVRAEALAKQLGNIRELGRSGYVRANCEYLRAEYVSAHKHSLESCTVAENSGDREGLAAALLLAAACQYQMGALEESNTALLQVLDIVAETPDEELTFRAHNMLGMILSNRDDHEAAERHFELAIAAGMRMGSEFYLQRAHVNRASNFRRIGVALRGAGRRDEALTRFRAAAAICEAIRASEGTASRENAAGCAGVLGEIYQELERTDEALALFDEMLQHGTAMGNFLLQAEALLHMGRHHAARRSDVVARDLLVRALDLATRANARRLAVDVNEALARGCETRGELQEALERYKCYHQLSDELVRAELAAAYRARKLWLDFQQTRREAKVYKDRFDSLARDHEELANRSTGLIRAAFEDSLTGLSNRRHLDVRLTELTELIHRKGLRLAVAILDIDFFKQINDRFSHGVGDEVLRAVAAMIRTHCREGDVSARFGGDEFVICFIGTPIDTAMVIVERLRSFVENHGWNTTQPGLMVRVSVGVTQACPGDDAKTLLARADAALYRAKESGRNQVRVE